MTYTLSEIFRILARMAKALGNRKLFWIYFENHRMHHRKKHLTTGMASAA